MQMSGSEADTAMLRRTEENYSQLKAELNQLAAKYLQLQKKDGKVDGTPAPRSVLRFLRFVTAWITSVTRENSSLVEKDLIEFLKQGE